MNSFYKVLTFTVLLVMCMSVAVAADVTDDTSVIDDSVDEVNNENINNNEKISKTVSLNSNNFDEYVTNGRFNDKVNDGDTIDIDGKLDSPKFALEVDKPVNIVSSTGDAYIDFDTHSKGSTGDYTNGIFQVTHGGAGSNITGITFHNTRVTLKNTNNICISNISVICEQNTGQGVGSVNIDGSENLTITNSYFETSSKNAGHSNVVFMGVKNVLFENNTAIAISDGRVVGNVLYITTYNSDSGDSGNITIRNNTIRSYIPEWSVISTCYCLALSGSGHLIENNYISGRYAVMPQYADSDYDFTTELDDIIFRNNYVEDYMNHIELTFPGQVYNNTFKNGVIINNAHVYNNTFNSVTIQNNVKFENNTAKNIIITGINNLLDNNEVYSNEDYAVTVSGNNNTLTNNKIAGYLGRGEKAISNSTEIISINNSEDISRVFYIDDDSFDKYFTFRTVSGARLMYDINVGIFRSGDVLVFSTSYKPGVTLADKNKVFTAADKITIINSTIPFSMDVGQIVIGCKILPAGTIGGRNFAHIYNSTIYQLLRTPADFEVDDNSIIFVNYRTYEYPKGNVYAGDTLIVQHLTLETLPADSIVYIMGSYDQSGLIDPGPIIVDNPITIKGLMDESSIDAIITFNESSLYSNVEDITFKQGVYVNTSMVFNNCTFNDVVKVNAEYVTFENCTFNNEVILNSTNHLFFKNNIINSDSPLNVINSKFMAIENNIITTTSDETILFDEKSISNTIKNNLLTANDLVGDDSVVGGDNTVEDNGVAYNTSILIDADILFKNDKKDVTITVYNILNNTPVDKGYVEVYLDGVLQGIKPLVNGQVTLEVNTEKSQIGTVPLKVWYYDGIRYANNVTSINVDVVKSNVTITVDEFTAKLNEETSITATFLNSNGNSVQDTNVTFTIGRSSYTVETVDGVATLDEIVTKEWLDAGKVTVSFPITDAYNSNTTTVTFSAIKDDVTVTPDVTVDGAIANIKLTLTDSLGGPVTDGRVSIKTLDGSSELASGRVTGGVYTASVTLPEDYTEEYLLASYTGSYYYNDFERNVKITQMLNSTISVETNSPLVGEELIINGKLTDSKNNPIANENITLDLNGTKVQLITDDDGNYNYSYVPALGTSTITVTFNGNPDTYGTSTSKNITIRDTDREMNEVLNQLDELTSENAKLKEQLENLTQLSNDLKEQLANQTSELSEQNSALQQQINTLSTIISTLTDIIDKQNEQIESLNNLINNQSEQIAALTAADNTTIVFNQVTDAKFKADVVISGMLNSQKGLALSGQTITLTIGDKPVNVTTKNGEFEYTTSFKNIGEQTVTASYAGNDNYNPSEATLTFNVEKQDVIVTVDAIADTTYGDNVTITGKFTDVSGKAISNSNVRLVVNGKKYIARTDKTGAYTVDAKVTQVGENTVTVGYAGNTNYNAYEDTITFNAEKQDVIVTVNKVEDTKVGENITITGTFTYANGKAVTNSNVKILINGKKYLAKTDSTGAYTLTTLVTKDGINNITVGYSGNDKLNAYEDTITFNAEAQDVIITADNINDVNLGENVTITGKFTDKNGKAITNSVVRVTFNGKKYSARTDTTGTYAFTATTTTEGTNTVTLSYAGSAKYNAYETNTPFNVIKTE